MFKSYQPGKAAVLANKAHSLSHTKWMCKYHIVFTPKYRRKLIYSQYRDSLGEIFRNLCRYKGVEIIEGHLMPDHVHMLVSIPPKIRRRKVDGGNSYPSAGTMPLSIPAAWRTSADLPTRLALCGGR